MFTARSVYPNLRHVRFYTLAFQKHHPCIWRELPCYIHTSPHQTSRIEHGTHTSKPPPASPQKYDYMEHGAPAGGAAAAAPEGCARRPVGTYLYLHAVSAGKPVAMLGLARYEAERGTDSCDPYNCEAMYGGFWKSIISVHHRDLPLGQSDMSFRQLNTRRYSPVTAGTMSPNCFLAKKGTDGSTVGRGCWSWRRTTGKQR
jgi:hypothetical protein